VTQVRVSIPAHLRRLAKLPVGVSEVAVEAAGPLTVASVLDALERLHPQLRGTIRELGTGKRRAYLRLYACGEDISHESLDQPLPAPVSSGEEPLYVVGAIAGGTGWEMDVQGTGLK
jgi:molybdopterin synthase sulfur carrier subunit